MKSIRIILIHLGCVASASLLHGATLQPISVATAGSTTAAGNSFLPTIAANASRIVFVSHANNLVANDDTGPWTDVFVRDWRSNTTVLASVSVSGLGGGNGDSAWPSLSANGRFVTFASLAGNLTSGDSNQAYDVFLRDVDAGTTSLVSVDADGNAPSDPNPTSIIPLSGNPMLAADASRVLFESRATNLTGTATVPGSVQVYARNLEANVTSLVSVDTNGSPFSGFCELTSISTNGDLAAFIARTSDSRFAGSGDVYVRNLASGTTIHASAAVAAYGPTYRCADARLTPGGEFVVYLAAGLPKGTLLFRHELSSGTTLLIATNVAEHSTPQISRTGRYVSLTDGTNIFRWDAADGNKTLVSANTSGTVPSNGRAGNPVTSSDGNTVLFVSNSSDLTAEASTNLQVYARDIGAGTTRLLSVASGGGASAGVDFFTVISALPNGAFAAFDASAADLVATDANASTDAFLVRITSGPLLQILRLPGTNVELKWTRIPSVGYEVQYKENLEDPTWANLNTPIAMTEEFASALDSITNALRRFYRILELP